MNRKIRIFAITVVMIISILNVKSYAVQSFNFKPSPEEKVVSPGETVEIEINLDDVKEVPEGINTVVGYMQYEEKLFENIEFVGENKWEVTYNNKDNNELYGKFAIVTLQNGIEENTKVATLKMKLKGSLPNGETEIKFSKLVSSDGYNSINTEDKKVKLIIVNAIKENGGGDFSGDGKIDTQAVVKIIQNIRTGDNIIIYVALLGIAVGIIVVVKVIKKKNKKDKDNK